MAKGLKLKGQKVLRANSAFRDFIEGKLVGSIHKTIAS